MNTKRISSNNYNMLMAIVRNLSQVRARPSQAIQKLQQELSRADVLDPVAIPPNTVTIHSRVILSSPESNVTEEWILTMPEHADSDQLRISVLSPIGIAILGCAEGDEIEWETPGGRQTARIEKVVQGAYSVNAVAQLLYG